MEGIEIRTNMEEAEGKRRQAAYLLFLTAGVFGILSLFESLKGISFSRGIVYPAAALLCLAIWYTYYGSRRAYLILVSGAVAVYGIVIFGMEDVLREQIGYMANCVTGGMSLEPVDVTEAVLLLTELLTFFMAMSEFLIRSHTLLYLMTTLMLLMSPLLGIRVEAGTVLLLALFQISFAVMQTDSGSMWRMSLEGAGMQAASGKSGILAGLLLGGVFLLLFPAVALCTEDLYTFVYAVESRVSLTLNRLSGRDSRTVAGGEMSRGNNYQSGTPHLEVETDRRPEETLYLCGFVGNEYTGRGWTDSCDGEVFEAVEKELGWQVYGNGYFSVGNLFDSMYFMMNGYIQDGEGPVWRNLMIRHADHDYSNRYVPYYSQQGGEWEGGFQDGYIFRYYEQQDIKIAWDQTYDEFEIIRDWYLELQNAYADEVQGVYTRVPVQILPQLSALCHNNPQGSLEEITAFILYTLQSNAGYTLTPGRTPLNEDIVEYFLFENGKGYCEHFAAAATLMFRLYGVPARYAAGYMIQPSAFGQQENGKWKAVATDEAAHAWVEIFLEDYGWTPVEVTPAGDGRIRASYPGFDNALFQQLTAQKGWNRAGQELSSGEGDSSGKKEQLPGFSVDLEKYEKWLYAIGTFGVYSLCLVPLFLDYRRLRRLKKIETWGSRRVFFRILEMLHFAGILPGYDGTEADFAPRLAEETGVPEEVLFRMQEVVTEAAYGFSEASPEGESCVRKACLLLAEGIYGKLNWNRRLIFRYWKGFF